MKYHDGPVVKGRWVEGELIDEAEDNIINNEPQEQLQQQQSPKPSGDGSDSRSIDSKERRLHDFHERNQEFLKSPENQQYLAPLNPEPEEVANSYYLDHQSQEEVYHHHLAEAEQLHRAETEELHQTIYQLQEQNQQLTHELRITQDSHQINKDQSRAEIEMLHTELDRQNSRHEQIVASLRDRLVESEMARMKMQEQLSNRMDGDAQREEELKTRWEAMAVRVLEDKQWVDEQMTYWKESMEEHRKRLDESKVRGRLDAELDKNIGRKQNSSSHSLGSDLSGRRINQRRLWGADVEGDDSEEDEEEARLFGKSD